MSLSEELLKQILEIVKGTKDFVVAESPSIVREFINWEIWKNTFGLCVFGGFAVVMIFLGFLWIKDSWGDVNPAGIVLLIIGFICLIGSLCCMVDLKKIQMAPKVYMIDAITERLREHHD